MAGPAQNHRPAGPTVPTPAEVDALIAQAYESRHEDTRAALALNRRALALALTIDYAHGVAWGGLRTSLCLSILGEDADEGHAALKRSLALLRSLGDHQGEAEALNLLGNQAGGRNDHEAALLLHRQCLALRRQLGDEAGVANSLNNIGVALLRIGRIADALEQLYACLEAAQRAGNLRSEAYAHFNTGQALAAADELALSQQHLERALALIVPTRDRAGESTARVQLGLVLLRQGAMEPALAHLQRALALAEQAGNRGDIVRSHEALAQLETARGAHDRAQALLDGALHLLQGGADREGEAKVLSTLGRLHLRRGAADEALQALEAASAACSSDAHTPLAADVHEALSELHEQEGRHPQALLHLRRARETRHRLQTHNSRSRVRELLTRAQIEPLRRTAEAQAERAESLAEQLDQARRWADEKQALLEQLSAQATLLEQLAREDGLTAVANRRWLDLQLERECERARRHGHPLALAMVDVDHFKEVNDRHSHALGDEVLRVLARLLRDGCRAGDLVGRYGGEEFVLLLPDTHADNARHLAEKLRARVQAHDWAALHPALAITVSVGIASADGNAQAAALYGAADRQLYRAKAEGRNRVCA